MRAVVVETLGGPEVLQVRDVDRPSAGPGETLIKVDRAGINFSDIGRRRNGWTNPTQPLPVIPGFEVVGRRVSDGDGGRAAIETLLRWISEGRLTVLEGPSFPIGLASEAHAAIEARATVGKVSLVV